GTAKGGAVLGIASELGIPVKFIGVGEQVNDFAVFEASEFLEALLEPQHAE
ncbi:MAG: signal recognition particle-docking protein FtsY, partial [Planctomycetota bacterium]|nr:signal recognition particle-docking protein FtsY [Planctomycetota bacterium]